MISGELINEITFVQILLSGSNDLFFVYPYLEDMIQILLRVFPRVFPSTNYRWFVWIDLFHYLIDELDRHPGSLLPY